MTEEIGERVMVTIELGVVGCILYDLETQEHRFVARVAAEDNTGAVGFEARKILVTRYRYRAQVRMNSAMWTIECNFEIENMLESAPQPDENRHYYSAFSRS